MTKIPAMLLSCRSVVTGTISWVGTVAKNVALACERLWLACMAHPCTPLNYEAYPHLKCIFARTYKNPVVASVSSLTKRRFFTDQGRFSMIDAGSRRFL